MRAAAHAALDRFTTGISGLMPHQKLTWVSPPPIDARIPLGMRLDEPQRIGIVWPQREALIDIPAPTTLLPAPNDRLRLRFWPAAAPRRGSVVFAPPWKFATFAAFLPLVHGLRRLGFDVVGYPLPFHFERTPRGAFSGELFATWDMPRTGSAIRAACLELCALCESLQSRGPVVMLGMSLGGYLGAMASVVAPLYPRRGFRMARMALVVPPASILHTFLHTAIGTRYRRMLEKNGGRVPDTELLEELATPFTPHHFPSALPGEHILVLAGKHDAVVPAVSSQALAAGLGARLRLFRAGHVSAICLTPALWREVGEFLRELPAAGIAHTHSVGQARSA